MDFLEEAETSWVSWFCGLRGNELFCEVDHSFITDDFNMMGLAAIVPNYRAALDIILDRLDVFNLPEDKQYQLAESARLLYGLIHARFILTNLGLARMATKYENGDFGVCSRVFCESQYLLPVGLYDAIGKEPVLLYCARCNRVYKSPANRHRNIDGCFFGSTFPHLFLMVKSQFRPAPSAETYIPKLFGFNIRQPVRLPPPSEASSADTDSHE
ncbi:hypothetical protein GEMRC1_012400 [Eukaryota sp. GEM-RC1]